MDRNENGSKSENKDQSKENDLQKGKTKKKRGGSFKKRFKNLGNMGKRILGKVDEYTDILGGCVDVIITKQKDGSIKSLPFIVRFGRKDTYFRYKGKIVRFLINGKLNPHLCFKIGTNGIGYIQKYVEPKQKEVKRKNKKNKNFEDNTEDIPKKKKKLFKRLENKLKENETNFKIENNLTEELINEMLTSGSTIEEMENAKKKKEKEVIEDEKLEQDPKPSEKKKNKKEEERNLLTSEEIALLDLKPGRNTIEYVINSRMRGYKRMIANIFLWNEGDKVIICDIDGTISKSDLLGHVFFALGVDWHCSKSMRVVVRKCKEKGYKLIYLTARSLIQSISTRNHIQNIAKLPPGAVVVFANRMYVTIYHEAIKRNPEIFKKEKLSIFSKVLNLQICGGFGNKNSDFESYKFVGIDEEKIFIVNPKEKFHGGNKKTLGKPTSYLVDHFDEFF